MDVSSEMGWVMGGKSSPTISFGSISAIPAVQMINTHMKIRKKRFMLIPPNILLDDDPNDKEMLVYNKL